MHPWPFLLSLATIPADPPPVVARDPVLPVRRREDQERREWYDRMEQQAADERAEQDRYARAARARREEEEREEYDAEMERQYQEHLAAQVDDSPARKGADAGRDPSSSEE